MGNQFKAGRSNFPTGLELSELVVGWCRNGLMEAVNDIYKLTPMGLFWQNQLNRAVMIAVQYFSIRAACCGKKVSFDNDECNGKSYLKVI